MSEGKDETRRSKLPLVSLLLVFFALLPRVDAFVVSRKAVTARPLLTRRFVLTPNNDMIMPDYAIVDSKDMADRPSLASFLQQPRELVGLLLILTGTAVSLSNIIGNYNDSYLTLQAISIALGSVNAAIDLQWSLPPYNKSPTEAVSPNVRLGVVDDALLHVYSGVYTGCASWLALRTSIFCPSALPDLDRLLCPLALSIFVFSLVAPVSTLLNHHAGLLSGSVQTMVGWARQEDLKEVTLPPLSDTELLRARGLLAIGIIGCVYSPEVICFLTLGQDWWIRVGESFPGQPLVESSTALCGMFATQASMMAHRAGKAGVAPFSVVVPAFSVVCLLLAIFPCVAALYWLGDEISFFEFYSV